jgi:hypothetical protein
MEKDNLGKAMAMAMAMAIVMQVERIRARLCVHLMSVMSPALILLRFCLVSYSTAVNRC